MSSSLDTDHLGDEKELTPSNIEHIEGEKLLRLARLAIDQYLRDGEMSDHGKNDRTEMLGAGVFVTLWADRPIRTSTSSTEHLELRGCIGHLQSNLPIYDFVPEVAVGAATRDPRFPPLSLTELKTIRIEIAVLSPLRPITDLQQINIGQDGLMIEGLSKRGLLLPKVAIRMGWDRPAFLEGVCHKAGLPLHCWPGVCTLFAFTTIVFDEGNMDRH